MEMGVKERSLRYALKLFEDEDKWEHESGDGKGLEGALCVGLALMKGRRLYDSKCLGWDGMWLNETMQMQTIRGSCGGEVANWNDYNCPDIAALRAKLKSRIAHYEQKRLAQTPIAVIILGPGQNVRAL